MGQVTIATVVFDIYGEHVSDAAGPPVIQSAQNYFKGVTHGDAFLAASSDAQAKALVAATRMLDRQLWEGTMTDAVTPQPLQWPRTGATDRYGVAIGSTVIPTDIIRGCYELAAAILADAAVQTQQNVGSNLQSETLKIGPIELGETRFRPTTDEAPRFPVIVQEFVGPYLASGSAVGGFASGLASSFWDDEEGSSGGSLGFDSGGP